MNARLYLVFPALLVIALIADTILSSATKQTSEKAHQEDGASSKAPESQIPDALGTKRADETAVRFRVRTYPPPLPLDSIQKTAGVPTNANYGNYGTSPITKADIVRLEQAYGIDFSELPSETKRSWLIACLKSHEDVDRRFLKSCIREINDYSRL